MDVAFFILLIFIVSSLIHFLFIYFLLGISENKDLQQRKINDVKLTILICARNEAQNLKSNIPIICEQVYDELQVVVVNHKSIDSTSDELERLASQYDQLEVVDCGLDDVELPGKRSALSEGLRHATGMYVLLVDADCRPTSSVWAKQMVDRALHTDSDVVLGIGAYSIESTWLNRYIQLETFHTAILYLSMAIKSRPYMGVGRNLLVKKDVIQTRLSQSVIPGVLSGDDDLLIANLSFNHKMTVEWQPTARTLSAPKQTWSDYMKQKKRHVSTAPYYRGYVRWILQLFHGSQLLSVMALIILLFSQYWKMVVAIAIVRYCLIIITMNNRNKILKMNTDLVFLPIMELLFITVPGISFILNKINKSNEWN